MNASVSALLGLASDIAPAPVAGGGDGGAAAAAAAAAALAAALRLGCLRCIAVCVTAVAAAGAASAWRPTLDVRECPASESGSETSLCPGGSGSIICGG